MKEKIEKTRQKLLVVQDKTLGRVVPIPKRGSIGNKLAWGFFWLGLPVFFYFLYEVLTKK